MAGTQVCKIGHNPYFLRADSEASTAAPPVRAWVVVWLSRFLRVILNAYPGFGPIHLPFDDS